MIKGILFISTLTFSFSSIANELGFVDNRGGIDPITQDQSNVSREQRLQTLLGVINNRVSDVRFNQNVRTLLENHECNETSAETEPKNFLLCHYALGDRRSESKCFLIDYHNLALVSEHPVHYGRNGVAMSEGRRDDKRTPLGVFQANRPRASGSREVGGERFYSDISGTSSYTNRVQERRLGPLFYRNPHEAPNWRTFGSPVLFNASELLNNLNSSYILMNSSDRLSVNDSCTVTESSQ